MKATHLIVIAVLGFTWYAESDAQAQGYDDLDDDGSKKHKKDKKPKKQKRRPEVREIVKGTYAKANAGSGFYLGDFSGYVNAGTALGLALGQDFVDQEKSSMAWEIMFFQGIHNGTHYLTQADVGCKAAGGAAPCIEGDLRTYSFAAAVEYSGYPSRRVGLGARVGGGVLYSPLLMAEQYYLDEVVSTWGVDPNYHNTPHPIVMGGPTFEYYTKLSHFSIGIDADVFYAIGFDLGANITGALKYTF